MVSKSVELTVAGLSRGMLCGRADVGKVEHCAGDAAAIPVFSCDADNNGSKFDVGKEVQEVTSESGAGVDGDEVATAIVVRLSCS